MVNNVSDLTPLNLQLVENYKEVLFIGNLPDLRYYTGSFH